MKEKFALLWMTGAAPTLAWTCLDSVEEEGPVDYALVDRITSTLWLVLAWPIVLLVRHIHRHADREFKRMETWPEELEEEEQ